MKVLLFTHEQDIDGMGSIIVGKHAFKDFNYITCKTFEVNQKVNTSIVNKDIYNYDFIYITDICIKEPLLSQIATDEKLRDKILVLDHHISEIKEGNNKYSFVNIIVEDEKGLTSGTSLFYDYLISHNILNKNKCLDEFVELTRQYDTFEWKSIYNNEKARKLHILFEQLGYEEYIKQINQIILNEQTFEFNLQHLELIKIFECELKQKINEILNKMLVYSLIINNDNYKIGFVQSLYQYRNDLPEAVKECNVNKIDVLGMINLDKDTVSYRQINDVDVSSIAEYYGGKGHQQAASSPQSNEKFVEILKLFSEKNN